MRAAVADRKLLIYAGKGGVGKTTTSSATGLHLARGGKKVLVVTVDPAKRLSDALGVPVGFEPTPVENNLWALMIDPKTVVREFVQKQAGEDVKDKDLTTHPLFKYVSENMPGLNELLAIGKLLELRNASAYDVIVVDTAPTGHALTFLSAPQYIKEIMSEQSMINLVIKGWKFYSNAKKLAGGIKGLFTGEDPAVPDVDLEKVFASIKEEAKRIEEMLTDETNTVLFVVTNPELLAVRETVDILERVRELRIPVGGIVVNKVQPDILAELRPQFLRVLEDEPAKDRLKQALADGGYDPELFKRVVSTVAFSDLRRQMNLAHLEEIRKTANVPVFEAPLFEQEVRGLDVLSEFAAHLLADKPPARDPVRRVRRAG
ncbi:MAG TPA: ArsA family ATPase [Candidatus Thermoplasmatota archaeon]|nr:ArsA family ATPase [Candidatus Thermoplasmatota archaeon]